MRFLCAIFFLRSVFQFDKNKSKEIADGLRLYDKAGIYHAHPEFNNPDILEINNILDLIKLIDDTFFKTSKKKLEYRNLVNMFTKYYGVNSLFAIEHGFSFINMCILSKTNIKLYNDRMIRDVSKAQITNIYDHIGEVSRKINWR